MAKFNLNEYDTVESRIHKFYAEHPDGGILTEILNDANNTDYVVVRATIQIDGVTKATGIAAETRDTELQRTRDGKEYESVNYTSWVENAETSSIGRALANYNYSGNKRASREEMQKVARGEQTSAKAQELYAELRKLIDDKKMDGTLDEKAHATAVAWLDGHAKTIPGMTAAKKSLDARFAEADPTNDEIAAKAFEDGQGEIF